MKKQNSTQSDFDLAGRWFLGTAALLSVPWLLLLPVLFVFIEGTLAGLQNLNESYFIFLLVTGPLFSAYFLGGWLGRKIIIDKELATWRCMVRGVIVAAGSLAAFIMIGCLSILSHDYTFALETSPERSLSLIIGVASYMAPLVLIFGAVTGYILKGWSKEH